MERRQRRRAGWASSAKRCRASGRQRAARRRGWRRHRKWNKPPGWPATTAVAPPTGCPVAPPIDWPGAPPTGPSGPAFLEVQNNAQFHSNCRSHAWAGQNGREAWTGHWTPLCALTPLTPLTPYRPPPLKPLHSWQLPTRREEGWTSCTTY
eukprot:scaffold1870_cov96-Isochrysis_galbana.AAC.2